MAHFIFQVYPVLPRRVIARKSKNMHAFLKSSFGSSLLLGIGVFLLAGSLPSLSAQTVLTPVQTGIHDAALKDLGNGEWEVRTTGADPYFFVKTNGQAIDLKTQSMLSFGYFSTTGTGRLLIFVGSVTDTAHLITLADLGISEGWSNSAVDMTATPQPPTLPVTSLRITLGDHPGTVVRLREIRARPPTEQEKELATGRTRRIEEDDQLTARLQAYLQKQFPDQIASVSADENQIRIEGQTDGQDSRIFLAEIPMWEDITAPLRSPKTLLPITAGNDGRFVATVDRHFTEQAGHIKTESATKEGDKLLSAWVIVRKTADGYEPLSAMHYVDTEKAREELPPAHPRSRKGLGGCPFTSPELDELGISTLDLNIVLNDFMFSSPAPGRSPYPYAGRTWYINDGVIAGYDRSMKAAAEHERMVSAIILIRFAGDALKDSWVHQAGYPFADPVGIYVLPNFTSREGVEAYAAAINFLAERYSQPDGKYGRIHDWIMHNEINAAFFWTNAGNKTVVTYLDLYQKSMRVVYLLARQYDPNAKPLISLDHCWTKLPDPRCYAARDLLNLLVDFSRKEGDFAWGIAYHPYPQDISNPRTWEDAQATFDFNTPFLTFKNLEVLNAWVQQPRVAFRGKEPREIQLTEQGLNSPDYSEKSLAEQAAGLAYAWKKIEPLKNITAFQYHLWQDDAGEGGLRLGLREFSRDPSNRIGPKKPSWSLFQAIGTDQWEQASDFAKQMIGIKDWSEVQYTGEIK